MDNREKKPSFYISDFPENIYSEHKKRQGKVNPFQQINVETRNLQSQLMLKNRQ